MSRLTDLIAQVKGKVPQLGMDLEREFKVLSARRAFGLNFERQTFSAGPHIATLEPRAH